MAEVWEWFRKKPAFTRRQAEREITNLKTEVTGLRNDSKELERFALGLRDEVKGLVSENAALKEENGRLKASVGQILSAVHEAEKALVLAIEQYNQNHFGGSLPNGSRTESDRARTLDANTGPQDRTQ